MIKLLITCWEKPTIVIGHKGPEIKAPLSLINVNVWFYVASSRNMTCEKFSHLLLLMSWQVTVNFCLVNIKKGLCSWKLWPKKHFPGPLKTEKNPSLKNWNLSSSSKKKNVANKKLTLAFISCIDLLWGINKPWPLQYLICWDRPTLQAFLFECLLTDPYVQLNLVISGEDGDE